MCSLVTNKVARELWRFKKMYKGSKYLIHSRYVDNMLMIEKKFMNVTLLSRYQDGYDGV